MADRPLRRAARHNGTKISFIRNGSESYVVNADGSGLTWVTSSHPSNRRRSSDSARIVFPRGDWPNLFAVNIDGGGEVALMTDGGFGAYWRP